MFFREKLVNNINCNSDVYGILFMTRSLSSSVRFKKKKLYKKRGKVPKFASNRKEVA